MKRFFGRADVLIILVLSVTALFFLVSDKQTPPAESAQIIIENQSPLTVDLQKMDAPYDITLSNGMVIHIAEGQIRVISSPCRDKLCVQCGILNKDGDIAVCLPLRTLIKVSGTKDNKTPDAITY